MIELLSEDARACVILIRSRDERRSKQQQSTPVLGRRSNRTYREREKIKKKGKDGDVSKEGEC